MKKFNIPSYYRSPIISKVKAQRKLNDPRKKDFSPTSITIGNVEFIISRHFGFCYGVENAIEKSYNAIQEHTHKNIYMLSEMIHNPGVNNDLQEQGVRFIQDTDGTQRIPWDDIKPDDIVIIPAFGTTLEIKEILTEKGVDFMTYDTTCPFVEKVWNRSAKLGNEDHTIIIHGKYFHEETKATFSHSQQNAPSLVIKNMEEAQLLGRYILGEIDDHTLLNFFEGKYSENFNPGQYLNKIAVVNQTTMLASETQEIADYLKKCMIERYGINNLKEHFADTRDTLCYATNDNQTATLALQKEEADLAIVVGGYNSSNTTHLVELLENHHTTYFIKNAQEIKSSEEIHAFDIHNKTLKAHETFLPHKPEIKVIITSGASCPDSTVDQVMQKILSLRNVEYKEQFI